MKYSKRLILSALLFGFLLITASCGDDPLSSKGEPPSIPSGFVSVEPDISYFEDNNPQKASAAEYENFYQAKYQASGGMFLLAISQVYGSFFEEAREEEAEYRNGVWVWEYSYNIEGVSAQMVLTSEEKSDGTYWDMTMSYDDGETSYENYTIIEGFIASDQNSGNWTFNSLNEETNTEVPVFVTTWEISSETVKELQLESMNEEGVVELSIDYQENQPEYSMTFDYSDSETVIIYWNTDSGTGYYQEGTEENRLCWNSSFENTTCS